MKESGLKIVVYNVAVGGFALSGSAMVRLLREGFPFEELPMTLIDSMEQAPQKRKEVCDGYALHTMTGGLCKGDSLYVPKVHDVELRSHPVLVKLFQEMGQEAAGPNCVLRMRELDNETPYMLDIQDDGVEWVVTPEDECFVQGFVLED